MTINIFLASCGRLHEGLLRETVKNIGIALAGKLQECNGCSPVKELQEGIPTMTTMTTARVRNVSPSIGRRKSTPGIESRRGSFEGDTIERAPVATRVLS